MEVCRVMSVHRMVRCNEVGCLSEFVGTVEQERAAGWRRIGAGRMHHRCPKCRARIGTRPGRKKKRAAPTLTARRKYRYGREAYCALELEEIDIGRVREMLMAARGAR